MEILARIHHSAYHVPHISGFASSRLQGALERLRYASHWRAEQQNIPLLVGLNLYGETRRLPWVFQPNNKLLSSAAASRDAKSLSLTFPNSNQAISFAESITAVSVARTRPSYMMNGNQSVSR